jgi:hypothetical protein
MQQKLATGVDNVLSLMGGVLETLLSWTRTSNEGTFTQNTGADDMKRCFGNSLCQPTNS